MYRVKLERLLVGGGVVSAPTVVEPKEHEEKNTPIEQLEVMVRDAWSERRIDVVVVAHDEPHHLRRCLDSICEWTPQWLNWKLTVVDNGCGDHTARMLENDSRIGQLIRLDGHSGYLSGLHVASKETDGEWVVFVDPRVEVGYGWLLGMLHAAGRSARVAIVSPWSSKRIPIPPGFNVSHTAWRVHESGSDKTAQLPMPGRFCFMVRRMALEDSGGFDVDYYQPGGGEVADLYMRCAHAKWIAVRAQRSWVLDNTPDRTEAADWMPSDSPQAGYQRFLARWGDNAFKEYRARASQDGVVEAAGAMLAVSSQPTNNLLFSFRELAVCGLTLSAIHLCNQLNTMGWNASLAYTRLTPDHSMHHFPMRFAPIETGDTGAHVRALAALPRGTRIVATTWSTARDVEEACKMNPGLVPIYYVQDDERAFMLPNGMKPLSRREDVEASFGRIRNLVANSSWVRDVLKKLGHEARRIAIGVDTDMFHPGVKPEDRVRVMVHCRPSTPRRGWPFIVRVLNKAAISADFEVVGYDEEWDEDELDMPWRGNLGRLSPEEVAREMSVSHVFFGGSKVQGWGMPELEAMASGCALVCTDNRGIRDFGRHDKNCLIVKHGDVEEAAHTLVRVIGDQKLRTRLGVQARRTAEKFDWRVIAKGWAKFLEVVK